MKGQSTTEYLIVLCLVIIIALLVVGILGSEEQRSATQWERAPISVVSHYVGDESHLVIRNMLDTPAAISSVSLLNGDRSYVLNTTLMVLNPNEPGVVKGDPKICLQGDDYALEVRIVYRTEDGRFVEDANHDVLRGTCG